MFQHNKRHQKRARWALDSQQVARVCGGRYVLGVNYDLYDD